MNQVSIDFLLYAILFSCLFLACLCLYIIGKRLYQVRWNTKKRKYQKEIRDKWYQYFRSPPVDDEDLIPRILIPRRKYQFEVNEEILTSYVKNGYFPQMQQRIRNYVNMYFQEYYKKQLFSKRWSRRINVLRRIIDFQMESLVNACIEIDKQVKTSDEQFLLLRIYAMFRPELLFQKLLTKEVTYSEYEYKKLFTSIPEDLFIKLIEQMEEMPLIGQYSLLDIIGIKRNIDYLPYVNAKLNHEHPEIRIRALKAIYEIGYVDNMDTFVPFVESHIWEERLMAVKILGRLPLEISGKYLQKLMHDPIFLIRSQAATAIGNYKHRHDVLKEIAAASTDRYAVNMANEILARGK